MNFNKVDLSIQENRDEVYNFYQRHYTAQQYLLPSSPNELKGNYYILKDGDQLLAITKYHYPSPFLLKTSSTVVHKDMRGQGIGRRINEETEQLAKENGILKIACHIYVDNLPSIILKLKCGYLIEGLLRNHDEPKKHEYILGKEL